MLQKTIRSSVFCEGIGIHTGGKTKIFFYPSEEDSGIAFIAAGKKIPVIPDNISDTRRGTSLQHVSTVEHALSAVNGLGIDNIIIEVLGNEVPILDGSSVEYVKLLHSAGIVEQRSQSRIIKPVAPIYIKDGDAEISFLPSDHLIIEAKISFPEPFIGHQCYIFDEVSGDYQKDIAPARTFGYLSEVEDLKSRGLALGASLDNAIAILDDGYSSPLRFPDELARHKILDIMGDIAFAGAKIKGRIISNRAGHKLNIELVRRLLNES